jgi:rhodanese-related sulfurtransferase
LSKSIIKEIKSGKAYLIDVRTPEEYASKHLKYSKTSIFVLKNLQSQLKLWQKIRKSISIVVQETAVEELLIPSKVLVTNMESTLEDLIV